MKFLKITTLCTILLMFFSMNLSAQLHPTSALKNGGTGNGTDPNPSQNPNFFIGCFPFDFTLNFASYATGIP